MDKTHKHDDETHFGFQTVRTTDKQHLVRNVFDTVAEKYDLMNDVMSGGLHRLWKKELIRKLRPQPGMTLLDVAGGTGDIAFRFLDAARKAPAQPHQESIDSNIPPTHTPAPTTTEPHAKVIVCDINSNMLTVGRDRAIDRAFNVSGDQIELEWVCGNAESLPLPDKSVDAYSIAFGIRNVTHIDRALSEAYRVLKPGGQFTCLEFSAVDLPGLDRLYDFYSFKVIPELGHLVAKDRESYQYLVESIRNFPAQEEFKTMIEAAGFRQARYRNLSGGIVALHSGWRI
ncbi:MAG: bifunctional demethylmenaquinone methyltransferase/2-methoxy-6-polyprenyl-1,4-benzoquinol methylase [Kordiimonas sp.]|nr:bifunctional demethylmenaquinone methyltransferase/2-methoxy-6-polyprenyl-1,4-benzoquinol methylase [Kordiimonas sp.]